MTQEEAIDRLKAVYAKYRGDNEALHSNEDDLLTDIVVSLGWSDFMNVYDSATHCRWCA